MRVLKQRLPPSVVLIGLRDSLPHLPTRAVGDAPAPSASRPALTRVFDRCHYDATTAPRPRKAKIIADPIGIGVRVGGPYLPLNYCVGASCLVEISASAG